MKLISFLLQIAKDFFPKYKSVKQLHWLYNFIYSIQFRKHVKELFVFLYISPWPQNKEFGSSTTTLMTMGWKSTYQLHHLTSLSKWDTYIHHCTGNVFFFNWKLSSCCSSWKGWLCQFSTPLYSCFCSPELWHSSWLV